VWKNADGSEVWEYPQGPLGVETYMVTLGSDRTVREVRQVLSDETISKLHVGLSRDEVRRLLGRPRDIGFSNLNDERYGPGAIASGESATWSFTSSSTDLPARSRRLPGSR